MAGAGVVRGSGLGSARRAVVLDVVVFVVEFGVVLVCVFFVSLQLQPKRETAMSAAVKNPMIFFIAASYRIELKILSLSFAS
jgi:sensor domain CHASE-containing protein